MKRSKDVCRFIRLRRVNLHEHYKINRHISDLTFLIDFTFVGNDCSRLDIVIGILQEIVKGTVYGIVLARLDFYGMGTHRRVIVYQEIHLALLAIVVVKEFVAMGTQLLCNNTLIDGAQIDASHIIDNRANVVVIEQAGKQPDIVKIQLQQILLQRFTQWEMRIRYGMNIKSNCR